MTKVFYREYYDRLLVIIEGHSGFAECGQDIVCAAASILAFTLLNCLKDEESDKRLKFIREVTNEGYMCVEVEPFGFSRERITSIVDTCIAGFILLSDEYPENVRII